MKKKTVALIVVLALIVAGAAYVAVRLKNRGTDIIGVTTLPDRNEVIMNSKTGKEFVSGTGSVSVGEGERIRMEYDLSAGEIDVSFLKSDSNPYEDITADSENLEDALNNLPVAEDFAGGDAFGQEGVSGKGVLDFDAAPGFYTVYIAIHDAVGKAVVTAAG